ncbi:helix-turn-helix domain-containing protein [Ureibacillus chungkukjangi]|nr:helix-turn-helix domain-containing protein [Ureibacillus chungkukjangi]
MLSVSEETVRRWIRNNELKAIQEGKSYLVDRNDLISFVKEKAKAGPSTSIGKIASILPIAGGVIGGVSGLMASGASTPISKIIKMINSKVTEKETVTPEQHSNTEKQSIEEIEDYIDVLKRQRKKLDLQYQMDLLQIDEEIAKYQKIKQSLELE